MSFSSSYNFIDSRVLVQEDRLDFKTELFHFLRYWSTRKKPREILFKDIEKCYIDDCGASHAFDSTRPHLIIEHSRGRTMLAFESGKRIKIQPVIGMKEAKKLIEEIREKTKEAKDNENSIEKGNLTSEKDNRLQSSKEVQKTTTNTVKEYKRSCNECGKTWHSLVKREKKLNKEGFTDSCQEGINACTCNYQASAQYKKNRQDIESEIEKLRRCPECGSRNYKEEVIEYED